MVKGVTVSTDCVSTAPAMVVLAVPTRLASWRVTLKVLPLSVATSSVFAFIASLSWPAKLSAVVPVAVTEKGVLPMVIA